MFDYPTVSLYLRQPHLSTGVETDPPQLWVALAAVGRCCACSDAGSGVARIVPNPGRVLRCPHPAQWESPRHPVARGSACSTGVTGAPDTLVGLHTGGDMQDLLQFTESHFVVIIVFALVMFLIGRARL